MIDQATNLAGSQFLAKGWHAAFTMTHDQNQTASARDVGMLSPPIRIGEIGCIVRLAQRRITRAVGSVATRTVVSEQIADLSS